MTQQEMDLERLTDIYTVMVRIRAFDERIGDLYKKGKLPGFVHLYVGEEGVAAGACSALKPEDKITSTHRGHGHIVAKGADVRRMMAELYGRETGYCRGKGGSMHMFDAELGVLGANGIVGGGIPIAVGAALAAKALGKEDVTVCFFGDGAANQGVYFEAMNLAAIWKLPLIFLCENNHYTEWTRSEHLTAGQIVDRATPFGIPGVKIDGNDVLLVREAVSKAAERARRGDGPTQIEAVTYRHHAHNEGEEVFSGVYRSEAEVAEWIEKDPIAAYRRRLIAEFGASEEQLDEIDEAEKKLIDEAVKYGEESAWPSPESALEDLYADKEPIHA